jgi:hypothetical protein
MNVRLDRLMTHIVSDTWIKKALCAGADPILWSPPEGRPLDPDIQADLELAQMICSMCPVQAECYDSADREARKVTMRGGVWPTSFSVGRPRVAPIRGEGTCSKGHDKSVTGIMKRPDRSSCYICYTEQLEVDLATRRARRHAARVLDARLQRYEAAQVQCDQGHDISGPEGRTAHGICRLCKKDLQNEQSAVRWQRRSAAQRETKLATIGG